jgi:putative chitinase
MITESLIKAVMPAATPANIALYCAPLAAAADEFSIHTSARVAVFLAEVAVESNELAAVEENLMYTAQGLANTWPKHYAASLVKDGKGNYPPNQLAKQLHRRPEAIANNIYANRLGNRDEASGDGWKHRGAGLIQATGAENQLKIAAHFNIDPEHIGDWLRTPEGAARSAAWFFATHGCIEAADKGDIDTASRDVNGGDIGLKRRRAYFATACAALHLERFA